MYNIRSVFDSLWEMASMAFDKHHTVEEDIFLSFLK